MNAEFEATSAAGTVLRGSVEGEGPEVIALHGLTATRRYVFQGSRGLARRGYRVTAYDARGHGASEPAPTPAGYEYADLTGDLAAIADGHCAGRQLMLVGSSMGAATAAAYALERPDRVRALVQITPAFTGDRALDGSWQRLAAALDAADVGAFTDIAMPASVPPALADTVRTAIRQRIERHEHLGAVADALRVVPGSQAFDGLAELERLDIPALVIGSRDEADPGHPLAVATEYAGRLPRAQLVVEDAGESPLAWRGAALARVVGDFLDRAQE